MSGEDKTLARVGGVIAVVFGAVGGGLVLAAVATRSWCTWFVAGFVLLGAWRVFEQAMRVVDGAARIDEWEKHIKPKGGRNAGR